MKKHLIACCFFAFLLLLTACGPKGTLAGQGGSKGTGEGNKNAIEIVVDGGGANAAFNSTVSMDYDKYANPYPYNTLEVLANEWNKEHPGYKIKIASSSMNNDRETMVPALNQGTAPDIIFYLGTTISEDMNKGWFYDLREVLEQPNKYAEEGELGYGKWNEAFGEGYYNSFAPNGAKYTVDLELSVIGLVYNKTIFKQLGLKEPKTFDDFMRCQDAIYAYAESIGKADRSAGDYLCPYYPYYPWYDIVLETQLYSEYIDIYDVIYKNGAVNGEEFARAYMKKDAAGNRLYSPEDNRFLEKTRLNKVLTKYYPNNFEAYYAEQQFTSGNLVMMEAQGGTIRKIIDAVDGKFEIGIFSYPYLQTRPESMTEPDFMDFNSESAYYTRYNVEKYTRRGLSGYSSGWAITNTAMNKGQDTVDACIDFLMYVTAEKNNDRLINDKGFSIPLSGNTNIEYFATLAEDYKADAKNPNSLVWGSCCASSQMNKSYYDAQYLTRIELIKCTTLEDIKAKLAALKSSYATAINNLYNQNEWDVANWPEYTGDLIN